MPGKAEMEEDRNGHGYLTRFLSYFILLVYVIGMSGFCELRPARERKKERMYMELTKEQKIQALDIFETPEEFRPEALKMLSEQELRLILLMKKEIILEKELEQRIQEAGIARYPQTLIFSAYSRAVLNKVRGEHQELQYQITNFYARYPFFAQFEFEEYVRIPRERRTRLNEWDFEVYFGYNHKVVEGKMEGKNLFLHDGDFMTLEEAIEAVKDQEFIARVPCNCKYMMDETDKPRDVCMHFGHGDNSAWDRGHGQRITAEQAIELLKLWNSRGLMPNGKPELEGGFCNCDCPSCYPIQMAKKLGSQGVYPRAYWTIRWDPEKCINCGKCTKICNFEAFTMGEDKKVTFHPDQCWGCTVCTNNCPKGAITKTPKPGPEGPVIMPGEEGYPAWE